MNRTHKYIQTFAACFFLFGAFGVLGFAQPPSTQQTTLPPLEAESKRGLEDFIASAARAYGQDPALIHAVIEQESNYDPEAVRFEGHLYEKLRDKVRNDSKRMQLASSHGLMQVLGVEAQRRGVSYGALYDPETNIEVGTSMLTACVEKSSAKSKLERLKQGLSCYNTGRHDSDRGRLYAESVLLRFLARKMM